MGRAMRGAACAVALLVMAGQAAAHHEAIFGPQAGLFMAMPRYVALMHFRIYKGAGGINGEELVNSLSAGIKLHRSLSLAVIGALTSKQDPGAAVAVRGMEQPILGMRTINFLSRETSLLGVAAVELPAGQIDPPSWNGLGGALLSTERGRWSGIGYAYGKLNGAYRSGADAGGKAGDNLFLGAGLAYRIGGKEEGRWLFSPQLGVSLEFTGHNRNGAGLVPPSGGTALILHPTLVVAPAGEGWSGFLQTSLPAAQSWEAATDAHRYRLGAGIILFL